ncbi:radical SAM protein [Sulfurimonas lithotrophica]|uniref:Radical SAM protein n=1 Tax=Sulfurimonas lithotrophica TaxID=2590022 RepID=A0A5P8NY40_9BACT|nr:radical SAM protein [Sulfurimonas lithotrophica]QFR48353.1 radical SAM protein [Sulfurimonas lithotrophica]
MNILLMTGIANDPKDTDLADHMPIGLGYIAANIKKLTDYNIDIIDVEHKGYSINDLIEIIRNSSIDIIGISAFISNYLFCIEFTKKIKDCFPNIKIVIGGPLPTSTPELVLDNCQVDVIVKGAGEMAFIDIVNNIKLDSYYYNSNNNVVIGYFPENMDDLPSPDWELMDYKSYHYLPPWSDFPILSSRGCPYKCNYCYKINGDVFKERSIDNLFEELLFVINKLERKTFMMQDDLFFVKPKRVINFCNKIIENKLDIKWSAISRIDLLNEEVAKLLSKAGCKSVGIGIESGSKDMLKAMNKKLSLEKTAKNLAILRKYNIKAMPYVIIGYPGETLETLKETERFLIDNKIYSGMTYAFPFPATELWNIAKERNMLPDLKDYAGRKSFDVSKFQWNFTSIESNILHKYVESMKNRVLSAFIDNYLNDNNHKLDKADNIFIYGVGFLGRGLYDKLKNSKFSDKVEAFIDDDPSRNNKDCMGLRVYSLKEANIKSNDLCIIANSYFPEIMEEKVKNINNNISTITLA